MIKPLCNFLSRTVLLMMLVFLSAGCVDRTSPLIEMEEEAGSGVFISIQIHASATADSRAVGTPTPGEDGDGLLQGTGDENKIDRLDLFFFEDAAGTGINTENADDINLTQVTFHDTEIKEFGTASYSVTKEVDELSVGKTYSLLAVANAEDGFSATTLSGLRDQTTETVIRNTADNSGKRFLMASAGPDVSRITITPSNSETNPALAGINLERLAARVDYRIQAEYTAGINSGDKVKITHAVLVNDYRGEEYLFKRVTKGIPLDWNTLNIVYLGDEATDQVHGKASNYVLDPKTASDNKVATDFTNYFADFVPSTFTGWTELTPSAEGNQTFTPIAYTHENVCRFVSGVPEKATCMVFQATYIPEGITEGQTFYWYNNKGYGQLNEIEKLLGVTGLADGNIADYGIRKYDNGVCYYTYYIRHADDERSDVVSTMEYAIVRNNVYQLDVKSVYGPGGDGELTVEVAVLPWGKNMDVFPDF